MPLDSLLQSLKGVYQHVSYFLLLAPVSTVDVSLKVSKLLTQKCNARRTLTTVLTQTIATKVYFYRIRDLLFRVLSNLTLRDKMFLNQFTSIHQPASAPWYDFTWRSSYTLSKGPQPPRVDGIILYPRCFIMFEQQSLLTEANILRLRGLEIPSIVRQLGIRIGRVCSIFDAASDD